MTNQSDDNRAVLRQQLELNLSTALQVGGEGNRTLGRGFFTIYEADLESIFGASGDELRAVTDPWFRERGWWRAAPHVNATRQTIPGIRCQATEAAVCWFRRDEPGLVFPGQLFAPGTPVKIVAPGHQYSGACALVKSVASLDPLAYTLVYPWDGQSLPVPATDLEYAVLIHPESHSKEA